MRCGVYNARWVCIMQGCVYNARCCISCQEGVSNTCRVYIYKMAGGVCIIPGGVYIMPGGVCIMPGVVCIIP